MFSVRLTNPVYAPRGCCGMIGGMSTRRTSADRWRRILRQQQASGLTVAAFCRRAEVSQPSFYSWRRKLRSEVTFAEVTVSPAAPLKASGIAPAETSGIELRLPGGRSVMVRAGFDRQTLLDLLHALETTSSDRATRETVT